jgi:hypothetical protein
MMMQEELLLEVAAATDTPNTQHLYVDDGAAYYEAGSFKERQRHPCRSFLFGPQGDRALSCWPHTQQLRNPDCTILC